MYLLFICIYPAILVLTIVAIARNWNKSIRNEFRNDDELSLWIVLTGALFTSLAPLIGFLRFDAFGTDMPFSKPEVLSVEVLVVVSAICYWVSKLFKKKLSPFVNLLLRAGLLQGIILDFIVTIHFGNYLLMGIVFPFLGFELLAPPMALIFLLYEFRCNSKVAAQNTKAEFPAPNNMLLQFGMVIALIVAEQALLIPAGFHWDSLITAFTESKGFVLSADTRLDFILR
jgi:hypothetical protein